MTPPPIAREHCRHYSYDLTGLGKGESGPRCAVGIDLSEPGASFVCMPGKEKTQQPCPKRENWTAEEKQTWQDYQEARTARMLIAMASIPTLEGYSRDSVDCPSCDGQLTYVRVPTRAYVECSTPHCVQFEANVRGPWPEKEEKTDGIQH